MGKNKIYYLTHRQRNIFLLLKKTQLIMAIAKMKVETKMGEGFKTEVSCSHPFVIDQPKMAGGTDEGPNPLEFFLSSLGGCVCAIGRIVANQKRLPLNGMKVKVVGDINKDFLLGLTTEGRAGFEAIRVEAEIDADMTLEEKQEFLKLVSSRCPVADNLLKATVVEPTVKS